MIGFSASYAKTISTILKDIKSPVYRDIFCTILENIIDGSNEACISFDIREYENIISILEYNGFKIENIDNNKTLIQLVIKW